MNTFCTIITSDHLPFALTLYDSISKHNADLYLHILIIDDSVDPTLADNKNIQVVYLDTLKKYGLADFLYKKYALIDDNHLRWSLKPVFASWLLESGYQKVIYVDPDIYFFENYNFLFDYLDHSPLALTPHWYTPWPLENPDAFKELLTTGVFNAGFIACNEGALPMLRWWAEACHFKMGHDKEYFVHDDQKYLDYLPLLFKKVMIIDHKGCNLMAGNYEECKREEVNGRVVINGVYPIIFLHFNAPLVKQILMGFDPLLEPYYKQYKAAFEKHGVPLENFQDDLRSFLRPSNFQKIKWKLHIRTRIKRFLLSMAKKL
jgi:hypothetical protein